MPHVRRAAAVATLLLCLASTPAARASDPSHLGVLVVERDGALVVAAGTANGAVPFIARIGTDGRLRVLHRFVPYDTPGSLALIGGRVYGLDGFSESGGRAFEIAGNRFRTVFRVPDEGFGTIAYDPGVPAGGGLVFSTDGGRGAMCRPRKGHSACGAIELVGPGGVRRMLTSARPGLALPLAGGVEAAWFAVSDAGGSRAVELRAGRFKDLDTGGRVALAAAPFGAGGILALEAGDDVVVAWAGGGRGRLVDFARARGVPKAHAGVTVRSGGSLAYLLVTSSGYRRNESRLFVLPRGGGGELRAVRSWQGALGDSVQLHFVDARGDAVVSTERRDVSGQPTTRGTLLAVAEGGEVRRLPLGPLGDRAAVVDAVEAPDGSVWSLLGFYGSAVALVRSDAATARTYVLPGREARRVSVRISRFTRS